MIKKRDSQFVRGDRTTRESSACGWVKHSQLLLLLISLMLTLPSYGQPWSSILSSSRAIDWSKSGLPATLPGGETTPNPWTPPTRTQCVTSQCNAVSAGTVTVTSINSAISSAPAGTYVLIPVGTFSLSGTISLKSNVTLRGSGAQATKLTGSVSIRTGSSGQGAWGDASLLSGTVAKGATSVTIASGQAVPSAGRMAALTQCMTGFSAANAYFTRYSGGAWVTSCTGTISDPAGPWVCGGFAQCDRNGARGVTNPHFLGEIFWIPSGGVSGTTVSFTAPIKSPLWSTARTASLMWMNSPGTTGAGLENFTYVGWIKMEGCYGCWMQGLRIIFSDSNPQLTSWAANVLISNSYFAANGGGLHTIAMGYENDPTVYDTNVLLLNNIFVGCYLQQNGGNIGLVQAYNYFGETPKNSSGGDSYAGDFPHNPGGQMFMLREGNQITMSWDDDTWSTHNFNTWFRNWASGFDFVSGGTTPNAMDIGGFSRFNNMIGNVIGSPQMVAVRSAAYSSVLGVNRNGVDPTGLTKDSLMRWGNFVYCTGDAKHCQVPGGAFDAGEVPTELSAYGSNSTPYQNFVPANQNLPASFFMNLTASQSGGTGLNWWKTCTAWATFPTACATYTTQPFPPIGPDVTGGPYMSGHAYDIPARLAWNNLPSDPAYPGTNIKQFDQRVYQADSGTSIELAPASNLSTIVK